MYVCMEQPNLICNVVIVLQGKSKKENKCEIFRLIEFNSMPL